MILHENNEDHPSSSTCINGGISRRRPLYDVNDVHHHHHHKHDVFHANHERLYHMHRRLVEGGKRTCNNNSERKERNRTMRFVVGHILTMVWVTVTIHGFVTTTAGTTTGINTAQSIQNNHRVLSMRSRSIASMTIKPIIIDNYDNEPQRKSSSSSFFSTAGSGPVPTSSSATYAGSKNTDTRTPPVREEEYDIEEQQQRHAMQEENVDTGLGTKDSEQEPKDQQEEMLLIDVSFEDIVKTVIFLLSAWMMATIVEFMGLPALVGEITCGFILGPPLLDFVAFPEAMALLGSFGLIGLLLDSGINLDIAQLRETGSRAVALAFVGTILALGVGLGMGYASYTYYKDDEETETTDWFRSSFAIGAAFAPSSFGVASQVLSKGEILNTPMGQIIVAASVTDDILGLILLSIMEVLVMADPRPINYIIPFLSSFGYLIVLGYLGIMYFPKWIEEYVLPRFSNKTSRDFVGFSLLFILMAFYLPLMYYSGASYLTGAFLAGLSFSQIKSVHGQYLESGPHLKLWLMRIFFSATIGFQVPVQYFTNGDVLNWGFMYVLPVLAKLPLGLMVPRISRELPDDFPYNPYWKDVVITTLSFTCRGEFNFIVAAFALGAGVLDPEQYAAVVFAILLSAIFCPLALTKAIRYYNTKLQVYMSGRHKINRIDGNTTDGTRPLFLAIQARTPVSWGIQGKFIHALESVGLLVIDHRSWHTLGMDAVDVTEIFCQDTVARVRIRHAFRNSNSSNSNLTPKKDQSVLLNTTLESLEDGKEGLVDDSDSGDGFKIGSGDSPTDTHVTASTFSTIPESPAREQLEIMEEDELEEDDQELEEIELRKKIVRDALVECLGHDVDPASFAIVVTQWQAIVSYDHEDIEETAAGTPGTYIGREASDTNLVSLDSNHSPILRSSRRRNGNDAGYRFVAPAPSVICSSNGIVDHDVDMLDLEHQQQGEIHADDEEEEIDDFMSPSGVIDNINDFGFGFDFDDGDPPFIPLLNESTTARTTSPTLEATSELANTETESRHRRSLSAGSSTYLPTTSMATLAHSQDRTENSVLLNPTRRRSLHMNDRDHHRIRNPDSNNNRRTRSASVGSDSDNGYASATSLTRTPNCDGDDDSDSLNLVDCV